MPSDTLSSMLGRLQHEDALELSETLKKILDASHPLDQVIQIIEKRIDEGTYILGFPLASLISQTRSSSLYKKAREQLLRDVIDILVLYRGQYPDSEIEDILCKRLYEYAKDDAQPWRREIVDAMREVGSEAVLPTLEAIRSDLEPRARVSKAFGGALGRLGSIEAESRVDFMQRVKETIEEIKIRIATVADDNVLVTPGREYSPVDQLIAAGESDSVEFKSSFRWDLKLEKNNPVITHSSLKTIAAFLNTKGGSLIIGIANDKTAVGIEVDGLGDEDEIQLHVHGVIKERMGIIASTSFVKTWFDMYEGKKVCIVRCNPSSSEVFVKTIKEGKLEEEFFVRSGSSSERLYGSDLVEYTKYRFPN
jgi:hypothetical protein